MTLAEFRELSMLATEWAFYGCHTSNVFPVGYGGAPPEGDEVGGVNKAEYGYRLFEDALMWIEGANGRLTANVARDGLRGWFADGIEPRKGTYSRLQTLRVLVRAHGLHLERQKIFQSAA
jgi:hypothetical protein